VGGDKDSELLYMATWMPLCVQNRLQIYQIKKGKMKVDLNKKLKFLTTGPGLLY